MISLSKKEGNVGKIVIVLTKDDRIRKTVLDLHNEINISNIINDFNHDDNITEVHLSCDYSNDITGSEIDDFMRRCNIGQDKCQHEEHEDNGEETDSTESNENVAKNKKHKKSANCCPECGDTNNLLYNSNGDIVSCESCMKIDAFQDGKKKGYELATKEFQDLIKEVIEDSEKSKIKKKSRKGKTK